MILTILKTIQLILAIVLIIVVLMQQKGAGLGAAFGGGGGIVSTRRGIDKTLYQATIAISILFFGLSVAIVMAS